LGAAPLTASIRYEEKTNMSLTWKPIRIVETDYETERRRARLERQQMRRAVIAFYTSLFVLYTALAYAAIRWLIPWLWRIIP
jgi:hypothetical protein